MTCRTHIALAALVPLLWTALPAQAQDTNILTLTNTNQNAGLAAIAYWTPERFKAARPMPFPQVAPGATSVEAPPQQPGRSAPASGNAHPPTLRTPPAPLQLFTPVNSAALQADLATPNAVGTFGAHYTSTRVFPMFNGLASPFSADRTYPYITVGKLFFSINGSPFVCSASVIQHRIVATAGHCIHSGTSQGFHSNWMFVPAYRDGTAPLLAWNWTVAGVPVTWAAGGGTVPNAADYGMITFADQPIGSTSYALGDLTGWLGWQTLSLAANHTSKLGYPCNLDSCQKMQDITSSAFRTVAPNNVEYGSDARGGSSGGPWVQNFQILQTGGGTGFNTGSNRVVGVTSYGYVSANPKVQGASIPDNRWVNLLQALCGFAPGNCL